MSSGASGKPDRAVVNGAGQAVSALRASVPSAEEVRELLEYQCFTSFTRWVNKASSWLTQHPRYNDGSNGRSAFRATCFDSLGRQCRIGGDFQRADNEGAFPVYWLWPDQVGPIALAAQGIAAGTDETPQAAQPEGQEPGPEDAP